MDTGKDTRGNRDGVERRGAAPVTPDGTPSIEAVLADLGRSIRAQRAHVEAVKARVVKG